MMSPTHPLMSIRFRLSAAVATAALVAALALSGAVHAQSSGQGAQAQQQQTPKQLLDRKDHGAVLQHGGAVGQYNRAPELKLDAAQKEALKRAVLAGDNAQLNAKDFAPAPGMDVPTQIKLHPMPAELAQQIPALKYYHFANMADRHIAVVDAMSRKVVDVIVVETDRAATQASPQMETAGSSSTAPSGTPGDNLRAERALNSESGRSGKAEPGAQVPTDANARDLTRDRSSADSASQADATKPSESAKPSDATKSSAAAPSGTPGDNQRAERALNSESGQAGKAEPGAQVPTNVPTNVPAEAQAKVQPRELPKSDAELFRDGVLSVAGAPQESQTKPAKFSKINAALDARPIMAAGPGLTDAEAAEAYKAVMADTSVQPVTVEVKAEQATALPNLTPAQKWPDALVQRHPGLSSYAYVKTSDKVLIVTPANKIVVGWIDANGQNPAANLGQRGTQRHGS